MATDYEALAKKYGGQIASSSSSAGTQTPDYDALIAKHGGTVAAAPATATTQPETQPYQRQVLKSIPEQYRAGFESLLTETHDPKRQAEVQRQVAGIERQKAEHKGALGTIASGIELPAQFIGGYFGGVPGGTAAYTASRQLTGKLGLREEEPVLTSATTGLLTELGGKLLGKGVEKVVEKVAGKGAVKAATVEELKQAEDQAWGKVADSTATFKDPVPLKDKVDKLLSDKGFNYHPSTFPALNEPIKELNAIYDSALKGVPANIHDMRTVRTLLQDLRMSGGAKAKEKELAGRLMDELDDYVIKNGGADAATWKEARDTTNQLYRSRDVQNIVKSAEESSKATSKEIRSQFKDILNSNQIKMYTPEQQAIIKQIADGTATEKTLEYVGIMAPKSVGFQKIISLLGYGGTGAVIGGPVGAGAAIAAYSTGAAARGTANALAKSRVNMLDELIRGGQMPQTIQLPQTTQRLFPAGVNVLANQLQGQQ